MSTMAPTIAATKDVGFISADVFATFKGRDLLAIGVFTAIGLAASLALIVLFPSAASSAALALLAA